MKTKIIITGGKVHEVGYRFFLADSANAYGIYNFRAYNTTVNNLQAVVAVVEGEEEDVKNYLGVVKENFPEQASVKEVAVKEYTGHIPTIDSFFLRFMAGQLNKGVPAILRIDDKQDKMLEKQDAMLEKQDAMLQKQDETIAVIKEESHKTRKTVREESYKTRDELKTVIQEESQKTRGTLREESRMTRDTLVEHLKNDIAEIRAEIAEIKEKYPAMLGEVVFPLYKIFLCNIM